MDIDANLIIGIITGFFVFFVIERRYRPSMKIELAASWLDRELLFAIWTYLLADKYDDFVKSPSAALRFIATTKKHEEKE